MKLLLWLSFNHYNFTHRPGCFPVHSDTILYVIVTSHPHNLSTLWALLSLFHDSSTTSISIWVFFGYDRINQTHLFRVKNGGDFSKRNWVMNIQANAHEHRQLLNYYDQLIDRLLSKL